MVSVDLQENPDVVAQFQDHFRIQFPIWIDRSGQGPAAFGVQGHPNSVLIDRAGRIVGRILGERDWSSREAHQLVEWLLKEGR